MEEPKCFHCGSSNVVFKDIQPFDNEHKSLEIEEIMCNDCHRITKIPHQNKPQWVRDSMEQLESEGYTLNMDKVDNAIKLIGKRASQIFLGKSNKE